MALSAQVHDVQGFLGGAGAGIIVFCVGLGLLLNALLFTRPRKNVRDHSLAAESQNLLDTYAAPQVRPGDEVSAAMRAQTTSNLAPRGSVTEHTTLHLKSDR